MFPLPNTSLLLHGQMNTPYSAQRQLWRLQVRVAALVLCAREPVDTTLVVHPHTSLSKFRLGIGTTILNVVVSVIRAGVPVSYRDRKGSPVSDPRRAGRTPGRHVIPIMSMPAFRLRARTEVTVMYMVINRRRTWAAR